MAKRKRNIQILFCVSPEEKKLIRRKMIESKTKNMGAYLRKMAIDGYIVNTDTTPLKKQYEEIGFCGLSGSNIFFYNFKYIHVTPFLKRKKHLSFSKRK